MKKIIFLLTLSILCVGISFAQTKTRLGVTAGLNVSNENYSGDISLSTDYKAGFQAGVIADFGISEKFSIMPELLFSQRGTKYSMSAAGNSVKFSETLNYLQLPINAAYKFDVGVGSKVFVFAGPYFGYGLSGNDKLETTVDGQKYNQSEKVTFGSNADDAKAFDFGINVGVGYEYEKIFFKLQWNPGLMNLSNVSGTSVRNTNIAVSVGYFFN